jgi:hypothetical protein
MDNDAVNSGAAESNKDVWKIPLYERPMYSAQE